jgi:hypothetical protein
LGRNEVIREEAEEWRRQGRIDTPFYEWLRQEYSTGRDQGTERRLQQILLAFAGILAIIGIVTLVGEYWHNFNDLQKLWILRLFVLMAIALGTGLYFVKKTRVLAHVFLPLAIPLYLFSMAYADPGYDSTTYNIRGGDEIDLQELSSLIAGFGLTLAALVVGLRKFPTLAMGSTPGVVGVLFFLQSYLDLTKGERIGLQWGALLLVVFLHALLLASWLGAVRIPFPWDPLALRLALFANVPMGFILVLNLVEDYTYPEHSGGVARYDATIVGVICTATYSAILLGFGLRLGLPELVAICGGFLIVDAVWLGAGKGGVLGAVLAILATAVLMGVLAQRGLLRRIFRPRAPPTSGYPVVRGRVGEPRP